MGRVLVGIAIAVSMTACAFPLAPGPVSPTGQPAGTPLGSAGTQSASGSALASGSESPQSTEPSAALSPSPGGPTAQLHTGRVLDLEGRPVASVLVRAFLVSNNSGSLVSNNSGSLISHNGSKYRIAADSLETLTDAQGYFRLELPADSPYNLEAVLSDELKAIALDVHDTSPEVQLRLAYTGTLSGRVSAPDAPQVTDFTGVDVFIPGTSYLAKTDSSGYFTLDHVPVGTFSLVAAKQGLGTAQVGNVEVRSRLVTTAPTLPLSVAAPTLSTVVPANGGPGTTVLVTGDHFGASSGEPFSVTMGGVAIPDAQRLSDTQIRLTVPQTANAGGVVVTVAGLNSAVGAFSVLQRLALWPAYSYLPRGRTATFSVTAYDTLARRVEAPSLTWSAAGLSRVSDGVYTASSVGTGSVRVTSGTLAAAVSMTVTAASALVTWAGDGTLGAQDGIGSQARFNLPNGVATAPDGTIYVAEWDGHRIRAIAPDGTVTTLAGNGTAGSLDGIGTSASLDHPRSLARDPSGNLYVAEWETGKIRKITPEGMVTTLALDVGALAQPYGLAVRSDGVLFVSEVAANRIDRLDPASGQVIVFAGGTYGNAVDPDGSPQFKQPHGLAFDPQGNLIVADYGGNRIRRITSAGVVSTLAGALSAGVMDAVGPSARFNGPHNVAVDAAGVVWVADTGNQLIRRIASNGSVTTVAGKGSAGLIDGSALQGALRSPRGLALLPSGDLVIADVSNHCVRLLLK